MTTGSPRSVIAYLVAVFVIGLATGATTGYTLARRSPARLPSEQDAEAGWLAKYKSDLSLTEDQVLAIQPLLPGAVEKLRGIWFRAIMTMGAVGEGVDRQIEPLLDDQQRVQLLERIRAERERRLWIARTKFPKKGADDTDLWEAAKTGNLEEIHRHLESETDVNKLDLGFGLTPLTVAAIHDQAQALELLLQEGADINARHADGNTALHAAAFFGRLEAVRLLLRNGADRTVRNEDGKTPLAGMPADWETIQFFAAMLQVEAERENVLAGRRAVEELLGRPLDSPLDRTPGGE